VIHPLIAQLREQLWNDTLSIASECLNRKSGVSVGRRLAALWESVVTRMWAHEWEVAGADEKSTGGYALLALGGFGRSIVAPYSDIDLLLFTPGRASPVLRTVSAGFYRDVFDLGWQVGFSAHTSRTVTRHILKDPQFLTAVLQARLLCGDLDVFRHFHQLLERTVRRYGDQLLKDVVRARDVERERYGQTVYILQPNVKRSPGGLRDLQLVHWVQRFGELGVELSEVATLDSEDAAALSEAEDFLWAVRQWLHWRAGRAHDALTRSDQWQLATTWGYSGEHNLLPAEVFMRDYFRKTEHVFAVAQRFSECARSSQRRRNFLVTWSQNGYLVERGESLVITAAGQEAIARGWEVLLEFLETSQRMNRPLDWTVWDTIRRHVCALSSPIPPEIFCRFAGLFESPHQLAHVLRGLHKVRLLERFIPAFEHTRGLLQFNQYHHYTVDEHSLRAVEAATALADASGLLGDTYRRIAQKKILHLALLLHDLGKGLGSDHCETGRAIAREVGERLALSGEERNVLEYLVGSHLRMNHLALRRDISDEQLVVQFATEVGSPEILQMLYVLTAADLMAVSPDNWTAWKADLLAELFQRTARYISDSGDIILRENDLEDRRRAVACALGEDARKPFFSRQLAELPGGLLLAEDVTSVVSDLRWLASLGDTPVDIRVQYRPDSDTLLWNIATRENVARGVFHRLTGALSSQGLEILAAQIYTLADGWILDKYVVRDPNFQGEPPSERIDEINEVIRQSLTQPEFQPVFVRRWEVGRQALAGVPPARVRVEFDNHSHSEFTIIEIFANDRPGLLYEVSRFLYQEKCFIWRAKIGTFLDQVVDVFYVTDQEGQKIVSSEKLGHMRSGLLAVIQ